MTEHKNVDVSLVIPLYNESPRVSLLQQGLVSFFKANTILKKIEIILVDDGSSDDTVEKLKVMKEELTHPEDDSITIHILDQKKNVGKGGALKAGVKVAVGKWILTLDADMAATPEMLLEWQEKGCVDLFTDTTKETTVYIASREHPLSHVTDTSNRRFMGRVFNLFVQFLCSIYENDTQCGFKLYPNHIAKGCFGALRDMGWAHDVEILKRAIHLGCCLKPLPIKWESIDVSKINPIKDSILMFSALFRCGISFYWSDTLGFRKQLFEHRKGAALDSSKSELLYNRLTFFLFMLVTGIVLFTYNSYGIAANEGVHQVYGKQVLRFLTSFYIDQSALFSKDFFLQGGLFDGSIAFVTSFFSLSKEFEIRHLLTALCGLMGAVGAWKLANHFAGKRAGFFCVLFLFISPVYYGQMFHNPEDIPFAVGYVWSIYFALKVFPLLPKFPKGLAVKLALALGLTMGVWVGGLYILSLIVPIFITTFFIRTMSARKKERSGQVGAGLPQNWTGFVKGCLFTCVASYLLMISAWPWALISPALRPFEALHAITASKWINIVLYQGRETFSERLPLYYVPHMLSIQMPELLVFLILGGILSGAYIFLTTRSKCSDKNLQYGALILAIVLPIVYGAWTRSAMYEGFRNLLFVVPLLTCMAAITFSSFLNLLQKKRGLSLVVHGALIVYLVFHVGVMAKLHPYQYIYYNAFAGGLPGASSRFETDYAGTALTEGVDQLVDFIQKDGGSEPSTRYSVMLCGPNTAPLVKFPPNMSVTLNPKDADFFLSVTRRDCHEMVTGKTILTVERFGVPLAVVKQRK